MNLFSFLYRMSELNLDPNKDGEWCVYDKDHMSALRIKNRSESDLRSCEVTEAVTNKAQKKLWGFNGIRTHDLRDTGAMLYQLSYEAGDGECVQNSPGINKWSFGIKSEIKEINLANVRSDLSQSLHCQMNLSANQSMNQSDNEVSFWSILIN